MGVGDTKVEQDREDWREYVEDFIVSGEIFLAPHNKRC